MTLIALKQWNANLDTQEVVIANQPKKRKIRQNPTEARKIHVIETSGKRLNSASEELGSLIMTETMGCLHERRKILSKARSLKVEKLFVRFTCSNCRSMRLTVEKELKIKDYPLKGTSLFLCGLYLVVGSSWRTQFTWCDEA